MTLIGLYERANRQGIQIIEVKTREIEAAAFEEGYIFFDPAKFDSDIKLKCALAHELGHYETGAFYNIYSPYDLWEKCERKANKRAAEILMPINQLRRALRQGYQDIWAIAAYFEVTQEFTEMALSIYANELQAPQHKRAAINLDTMMHARDLIKAEPEPNTLDKEEIDKCMATLRRLGILDSVGWQRDPLLELPSMYYDPYS